LHPAIREIVAGHTSAERWLNGQALPARLKHRDASVPRIARSLKAKLHPGEDAAKVAEELSTHPDVEWASLNYLNPPSLTPNDTFWSSQWGPVRVRADDAWDVPQPSTSLRVAIIDTGVDYTHPDLAPRIVYGKGFGGNANGDAMRDVRGNTSIDHGTHVAGIAAAIRNNNVGVAGVAIANIMAMGCATWNAGMTQYFICCASDAINDAVANGADAINCSFGKSTLASSESDALDNAQSQGVVVVVAAGNSGLDVDDPNSGSAGWNQHPWPLIVSNTRSNDVLNASSNYGSAIDLAAPGTSILSSVTTNYAGPSLSGNYQFFNGTSMASPHVAGGVALVKSMNKTLLSGSGVKDLLYRMAQDLGSPGKDSSYGYGLLQLDPAFLQTLKDADGFVDPYGFSFFAIGAYSLPYVTIAAAVSSEPAGSTLVLNGGIESVSSYHYPAQTITNSCILKALPDRAVVIGN
jgi:thermitase